MEQERLVIPTASARSHELWFGREVASGVEVSVPEEPSLADLSVEPEVEDCLRASLTAASVAVELPIGSLTIYHGFTELVRRNLRGRNPSVWMEGNVLRTLFAVADESRISHSEIARFSESLATLVGGYSRDCTIFRVVAPADDPFIKL